MEYIISHLSEDIAKKIFGNKDNAILFIKKLGELIEIPSLNRITKAELTKNIWKFIVNYWDYDKGKTIIRDLFKQTEKYKCGIGSELAIERLMNEWKQLNLGKISWPCSQGQFDDFVQRINSQTLSGLEKDEKVKEAAVRYRRLKELNTVRNDYLETLIFEKNQNIIPTLNHSRGVDFFIDGVSYDQKVAKSPTAEFKRDFGENWKKIAKEYPLKVAEYLYTYQDENRFGADPRLYVVFLDEDIPVINLKSKIDSIDISKPSEVTFTYKHRVNGPKTYKTTCFVILLSN